MQHGDDFVDDDDASANSDHDSVLFEVDSACSDTKRVKCPFENTSESDCDVDSDTCHAGEPIVHTSPDLR